MQPALGMIENIKLSGTITEGHHIVIEAVMHQTTIQHPCTDALPKFGVLLKANVVHETIPCFRAQEVDFLILFQKAQPLL